MQLPMLAGAGRVRRRFAHYEFRLDGNFRRIVLLPFNAVKQTLCGGFAHAIQGLAHGGQARAIKGSSRNIVETKNGYILGHTQALLPKSADSADRRDVVVSEYCSERFTSCQELLRERVTQHRRWIISVDLDR